MITVEKLNQFGANTAEGIARCAGSEALYLRLVGMIPNEKNFEKLKSSVEDGDLDAAFEAVHTLKGVLGNLSLTPMYDKSVELTEPLRARTQMDYTTLVNELISMKEDLAALCAD